MSRAPYTIVILGIVLASLHIAAQDRDTERRIVLPNSGLVHCRAAECSQLWKQGSGNAGSVVYPSQILTDVVKGEIVGLTAVYDKSVTTRELKAAISDVYGKPLLESSRGANWRVEREQFVISAGEGGCDGAKEVIYLKCVSHRALRSLVPSAHINDGKPCTAH